MITNTSEAGLQLAPNLAYAIGPRGAWIASNKWMITLASVLVVGLLVYVSISACHAVRAASGTAAAWTKVVEAGT